LSNQPVVKLHDAANGVNDKEAMQEEMNISDSSRCPKCHGLNVKSWADLKDDEQEIVKRLPAAGYSLSERQARHRWCTRCWFESTGNEARQA